MKIVSGKYKGRNLKTFEADNIRPTSVIVKDAICNKLQFDLIDASVLDLFGGTGNFGFEALSRGAKNVYICDNNRNSINIIKSNQQLLKASVNILEGDYNKCLKKLKNCGLTFDIIFLDPPYMTPYGEMAMQVIKKLNLLNPEGTLVFEHSKGKQYDFLGYKLIDKKSYGIKEVSYFVLDNAQDCELIDNNQTNDSINAKV